MKNLTAPSKAWIGERCVFRWKVGAHLKHALKWWLFFKDTIFSLSPSCSHSLWPNTRFHCSICCFFHLERHKTKASSHLMVLNENTGLPDGGWPNLSSDKASTFVLKWIKCVGKIMCGPLFFWPTRTPRQGSTPVPARPPHLVKSKAWWGFGFCVKSTCFHAIHIFEFRWVEFSVWGRPHRQLSCFWIFAPPNFFGWLFD